tara:strand:- start:1035 stop:1274 length:240 start_codon:yes stop_codon:yes gene_type:complete
MKTSHQALRRFINETTTNYYGWEKSSRQNMLLDKEGMEQSDKDNVENYLKSMGLMELFLRGYIREILQAGYSREINYEP